MKIKQDKKYSHWAYHDKDGACFLGEIRRNLEESDHFPEGWRVITKVPLGSYLPHDIMAFDQEVIFRGRRFRAIFLENWFYHGSKYTTGKDVFKVEKLHFEMEEIPEERGYDIDSIVARLNYGYNRTEDELQKCKQWLLEYQAANQKSAHDLDDFCFFCPEWIFEQIFGVEV